ncbi:HlyD family efflux transporter periplasmic adaptor subunit [Micromonospora sp. NPDC050417]|uniref:efflux RND transporter periplasmic adaptor subunit n=1 Tax=Micromonospora sp. NPDC050417 TaxID=3364280 RepID=UPI0037B3015A
MGIGLGASVRGRRVWWLSGGVAVVLVLSGSVAAYALTGNAAVPSRPAATARVDRGDVTLAIATIGNLRPAQTRALGFAGRGTVTEVKVRAGDQVSAGALLARLDPADAQQRVDSARDALTEARSALDTAQQRQSAVPDDGCAPGGGAQPGGTAGGGGGGTATGGTGAGTAVAPGPGTAVAPGSGTPTPGGSRTPSPSAPAGTPPQSGTPTPSAPSTSAGQSRSPGASGPGASAPPTGSGGPGQSGGTDRNCPGGGGSGSAGGPDPVLRAQQQVTSAELNLADAEEVLAGATITAPIAGRILSVAGGVGSAVNGGTFITLGDVGGMEVAASFPEADAGRLAVGLAATVILADRPGEQLPAKVTQVDPVGTVDGPLVRYGALLSFDQVPADALVGQTANVRVTVESVTGVLRAPATAVHPEAAPPAADGATTGPSGGEVLVRTPAGGTEPRQVTIGVRGDQYVEITTGLAESDEVVLNW